VSCSFFGPKVTVIVPPLSRDPKPCDSSLGGDSRRVNVACFRPGETGDLLLQVSLGFRVKGLGFRQTCFWRRRPAAARGEPPVHEPRFVPFPNCACPQRGMKCKEVSRRPSTPNFTSKFCDSIDAIVRSCNLPWQDVEDMKVVCDDKGLVCGSGLCWPTMGSSCMSRNLARTLARSLKSDLWWRGFPCQWGCQMRGIRRRFHVQGCAPHR
jgi:hypothetical protein